MNVVRNVSNVGNYFVRFNTYYREIGKEFTNYLQSRKLPISRVIDEDSDLRMS